MLSDDAVRAIRDDVVPRLERPYARNNFEGAATQRLYNVIEKTLACNPLVEHPIVLGLSDRISSRITYCRSSRSSTSWRGEVRQPLHYDDAFYPWPRPRRSLGAAAIWSIDPFTADNGATVVIPASHRWPDRLPTDDDEVRSVVMPAGSVVIFHGTLWHGGGANLTATPRLAVAAQYCAPFLRQQENYGLSVSRERARACSEHVQRLLGYSIHPPFMGFVDGVHPKRLL